ncbi:hypothetical protein C8R47DRAFT_727063 [Mycena vitilis]|nr:hypothetical protein C8R47DRAFT_727063 [Mycena vitilis]
MARETPPQLPALESYADSDLDDIETAAEVLALVVAAFLDDELLPLDALYTHAEPCRLALVRHDDLYTTLKNEFSVSGKFDEVRKHAAICRHKPSAKISGILKEMRPALLAFLGEEDPVWRWEPEAGQIPDEGLRAHVTGLKIPRVGRAPCILLHDLGNFSENPVLDQRVKGIFKRESHTFLMNASGTGKTRLAFEGLCQNWGFYFPAAMDSSSLGSVDLDRTLHNELNNAIKTPHFQEIADKNIQSARRLFRQLLLSRMLVFDLFAQLAFEAGVSDRHKKLWLIAQLRQRALADGAFGDAFDKLFFELQNTARVASGYVDDYISHLFNNLRRLFGDAFHLFIVIDEAQTTFRSDQKTLQDADGPYPILRELMDCWGEYFGDDEMAMVIAGTDMPKEGLDNAQSASRHRWWSDVGAFDNRAVQREYVSRFLPPAFASSEAGDRFLERMWQWCRGRHRATDSLLSTVLRDGFQSPHTTLNDFVACVTKHQPTDSLEMASAEKWDRDRVEVWATPIECDDIDVVPLLSAIMQDTLFHHLLTGRPAGLLGIDALEMVTTGFGRFVDPHLTKIAVDEPLMLVAAAKWFWNSLIIDNPSSSCLTFLHRYPPSCPTFTKVLAMYIARVFTSAHPLSKVFSFAYPPTPAWANRTAELVTLHQDSALPVEGGTALFSAPLASTPVALSDTISWLAQEDSEPAAFCLPTGGNPDLICTLRLASGAFIRVVLLASVTDAILEGSNLRQMIKRLEPGQLFRSAETDEDLLDRAVESLQALPSGSSRSRCPKILRVVASFPAQTHLKTATNKSTRGIANLNTGLFTKVTNKISVAELFNEMIHSVTAGKRERSQIQPNHTARPATRARTRSTTQTLTSKRRKIA